jgi:hypothetical protein
MLKAFTSSLMVDDKSPALNKIGGTIVYQYLKIPNIPCSLDYYEITLSLCDIFVFAYRKFMEQDNVEIEKVIKLDTKFKDYFLTFRIKVMILLLRNWVECIFWNAFK